jgi:prepilin-type N-terminal cleavage/methylation domain-containing protein
MRTRLSPTPQGRAGFTLIELIIGSAVMLIAVLAALFVYARSNKVSVEQQMITEIQNDVRSSVFFATRDLRMAGVGLPVEFSAYFLEGVDNETQGGEVTPDRIKMLGNIEDPINIPIDSYQGSAANLSAEDYSLEQYPYPDEFYEQKVVLILPNPTSPCRAGEIREITHVSHNTDGSNEKLNFSPGLAPGINPPGGLSGTCPDPDNYDGGSVTFINVKEYWLDTTGHAAGLTAGVNGYIGGGEGGILYCTHNAIHYPLARNIENFQVEYNGDLDNDSFLDGWSPWNTGWSLDQIARIQQVRIWVLGRTPQAFTSVSGTPTAGIHTYRRPAISNSPAAAADDRHKRVLLESTSNVRNMSLNLYNLGQR